MSLSSYESIAEAAMYDVWGQRPRGYQLDVITKLLKMVSMEIDRQGILLVQATGSGKSSVPQMVAVVDGGITVIIENTLALSSNQISKFDKVTNDEKYNIVTFHLDEIKLEKDREDVTSLIKHGIADNPTLSLILFSSPESLLEPIWMGLMSWAIEADKLRFLCVDEVHLLSNLVLPSEVVLSNH